MSVDQDMDLPLMANIDDTRVQHYMMHLTFDFPEEIVRGQSIMFFKHNDSNVNAQNLPFEVILDCRHLEFADVSEIIGADTETQAILDCFESRKSLDKYKTFFSCNTSPMDFSAEEWKLRIWKNEITDPLQFPTVIKVKWKTKKGSCSNIQYKEEMSQ